MHANLSLYKTRGLSSPHQWAATKSGGMPHARSGDAASIHYALAEAVEALALLLATASWAQTRSLDLLLFVERRPLHQLLTCNMART